MSASDLSGRDLDVAAARAFGWTITVGAAMFSSPGHRNDCSDFPAYSTDPATLDEKLAWLLERGCIILTVFDAEVSAQFMQWDADVEDLFVEGKDIHEATARLVVAVKEAMP